MRTGSSAGLRSKLTSFVRRDRRKRLAAVIFMPLAVGKLPFRAPPPGAQLLGGRRSAEGTAVRKPATDTWRGSLRTTFEDISVSANAIPVASPYSPVICAPLTAGKHLKSKDFRCFCFSADSAHLFWASHIKFPADSSSEARMTPASLQEKCASGTRNSPIGPLINADSSKGCIPPDPSVGLPGCFPRDGLLTYD